jgi:hypothetical protein
MTPRTFTRTLAATTALGALAIGPAAAPGDAGHAAAAKRITAAGVGQVKLGKTFAELRERGLIGRMRPGCPLGGPNTRSARLKAPLKGSVDLNHATPRRVRSIAIRGGAKARGVGIGATIAQIKNAFPKAKVDRDTEEIFNITLVKIPKDGGGRIQFAVDVDTDKTTLIGVPFIAFCE